MNEVHVSELSKPELIVASNEVYCVLHDHGKIICAVINQEDALKIDANARNISLSHTLMCYVNKKNQMLC